MNAAGLNDGLAGWWRIAAPEAAKTAKGRLGTDVPQALCFSQGAQFMLSRQAIRAVPLRHWLYLLEQTNLSRESDPVEGYLMEFSWHELIAGALGMLPPAELYAGV